MTPAEELRAAAKLLRETAEQATPGPWGVESVASESIGVLSYPAHAFVATIGVRTADESVTADAAWIALVSPALAKPLAAWLDSRAQALDDLPSVADDLANRKGSNIRQALDIARVINGRTGE